MASFCPAQGPDEPVVRGLLSSVDCNVRELVYSGYSALFQPSSPFSVLLTSLLTIFVAVLGYRLLLGRSQLRVSDFALTAVKLGAILALATRWDTYQVVVYNFLFQGPEQLAAAMLNAVQPEGSVFRGDVFGGLQTVVQSLEAFATGYSRQVPTQASPLLGGPGFGAMALTLSSGILLLSSLGVLLAAKIVLGLLLATGPLFIALLLFETTRGVFEGWLRACLAFAFASLSATLLLGVALTMLEPPLLQLAELRAQNLYPLGPVYSVLMLSLVFSGVSFGMIIAGAMAANGVRLPRGREADASGEGSADAAQPAASVLTQTRAVRVAAAAAALDRRDAEMLIGRSARGSTLSAAMGGERPGGPGFSDRRAAVVGGSAATAAQRGSREPPPETRLGQAPRRGARPRVVRTGARSGR